MAFGVGVQGLMMSSECKQNMHKHGSIMQTSIKKTTFKSKNFFFHCELQDFPYL